MDPSDFPPGEPPPPPLPRRELQGPRPTPLNVRKDSHRIKKPPVEPQPRQQTPPQQQQHRPPIIIYAVSPKVIHVHPSEFRSTVQRLTGAGASSSSAPAGVPPSSGARDVQRAERIGTLVEGGSVGASMSDRNGATSGGILSPVASPPSLRAISAGMFSSFHGPDMQQDTDRSISGSDMLCSPTNGSVVSTTVLSSPGAHWELLNQFQDL